MAANKVNISQDNLTATVTITVDLTEIQKTVETFRKQGRTEDEIASQSLGLVHTEAGKALNASANVIMASMNAKILAARAEAGKADLATGGVKL